METEDLLPGKSYTFELLNGAGRRLQGEFVRRFDHNGERWLTFRMRAGTGDTSLLTDQREAAVIGLADAT